MVLMNNDDKNILDVQQRIDLAALIKANKTDDCTQEIRSKKQSIVISNDVKHLVFLKKKYERLRKTNSSEFDALCVKQCSFLFSYIREIFSNIKKNRRRRARST